MKPVFSINYRVVAKSCTLLLLAQALLMGFDFVSYAQSYKSQQPLHGCGLNCFRTLLAVQDSAVRQRVVRLPRQLTSDTVRPHQGSSAAIAIK
jgi:hypothetical protein